MSKLNITDLSNDFSANPMTGDVSVKRDSDAIKQSLKNLLLLEQFDKPFNPDLNAGLRQFLFESLPEPILQDLIGQRVQYIIETYEPRIELVGVKVG
ncbi:MAG: GPW/gp25 family protein, partial [bacterium]